MTHQLREGLPPVPVNMAALPIDERGYPVPFFVTWVDGKPDFRVADARKLKQCVVDGLCWLCGKPLGKYRTYVVGPMCAVNRTSSEPPSHKECAVFSAVACPFLSKPRSERREANLPEGYKDPAGVMIPRNPGVTLLWTVVGKTRIKQAFNGYLFDLGVADSVEYYAEGRPATPEEVHTSIATGIPILLRQAISGGIQYSVGALAQQFQQALTFVPESKALVEMVMPTLNVAAILKEHNLLEEHYETPKELAGEKG